MPVSENQKLADKIAKEMFTNGAGQRAGRLILRLESGQDVGGWSELAVASQVKRILDENSDSKIGG